MTKNNIARCIRKLSTIRNASIYSYLFGVERKSILNFAVENYYKRNLLFAGLI